MVALPPVSLCPAGHWMCERGREVPVAVVLLRLSSRDPSCRLCRAFFTEYLLLWLKAPASKSCGAYYPRLHYSWGFTSEDLLQWLQTDALRGCCIFPFFIKYVFTHKDDGLFRCFVDEGKVYAQAVVPHPLSVFQACFLLCWQSFIIFNS